MYSARAKARVIAVFMISFFVCSVVSADGSFIDKVYHPYVQAHEKEIEWRWTMQEDNDDDLQDNAHKHRFAYGQSINDTLFSEIYLIGEKTQEQDFKLTAVELEFLWQMTEQGEYSADWGLLFELEHEWDNHISEVSAALIIEKEWQKWVATANLYLIYEWGGQLDNELETALAMQVRYRYSRALEPAIEFYSSDSSEGMGPVLLGDIRFSGKKKIHWEAGVIFALDNETPDQTLKLIVEFEF